MQMNELTFGGYVGRDAEDASTASGTRIVNFSLCHTEKAKREGDPDRVTWVRVKVFGGWCDTAANIRKGDNVVVRGKLVENKWKDKETGKERTSLEVIAFQLGVIQRDNRTTAPQTYQATPNLHAQDLDDVPF